MPSYNELEYPKDEFGKTDFPQVLVDYLIKRYGIQKNQRLLDVGCGRGFYANAFGRRGIIAAGLDQADCDFEKDMFPGQSDYFDIVFTKSTLEHLADLSSVMSEMRRVLKPNGLVICLVPDYLSQWKNFYDDITHITPLTRKSVTQIFLLSGFKNVKCERFTMLGLVLKHKSLWWLPPILRLLPDWFKRWNVVRFSNERMVLATATK